MGVGVAAITEAHVAAGKIEYEELRQRALTEVALAYSERGRREQALPVANEAYGLAKSRNATTILSVADLFERLGVRERARECVKEAHLAGKKEFVFRVDFLIDILTAYVKYGMLPESEVAAAEAYTVATKSANKDSLVFILREYLKQQNPSIKSLLEKDESGPDFNIEPDVPD